MTGNKDCLVQAGKTTAVAGGAGLFVSAMQNTMAKHNEGAKGIFTRTGGTIGFLAAMGGVFALTECAAESIRGESDAYNAGIAGCAAGLVAGIRAHSIPVMCAACAGVGATMFTYEYSGGNLKGALVNMSDEDKKAWRESFFKKQKQAEEA
ncbi:hypothetical protein INT43_001753 [Umbelopsis isabellina]|uniref:NADH dehydrogenase [ubiquinone] 1 alpha subcomplex subunit 11 n=1 Tax=Mortierella isabellina TaxID=91625 RepID=A0A8H7PTE0_MORIS|nr:hypothetical protein INT43_001753 [Umbelopsis isabellina]